MLEGLKALKLVGPGTDYEKCPDCGSLECGVERHNPSQGRAFRQHVYWAIAQERTNQDAKWGTHDHSPEVGLSILMEEVGEAARAALEGDGLEFDRELIQVAAVAVAMLEARNRVRYWQERGKVSGRSSSDNR